MRYRNTAMKDALASHSLFGRTARSSVKPVSQITLSLQAPGDLDAFEMAREEIIAFVKRKAGRSLPSAAVEGKSFSIDEIGFRRIEGIAIDNVRGWDYWMLRFDDDDQKVARRSWVIEAALAKQDDEKSVLFGTRLQCIARGGNPPYDPSIPSFARSVIGVCDARLDHRRATLGPWFVDSNDDVERLVALLTAKDRTADVVVVSLPGISSDMEQEVISSADLAEDLAGAAHVVVIAGRSAFLLSDLVGREFSVFGGAVRTYLPGFDPETESPFAHPFGVAAKIRDWNGGPDAYRRFVVSKVLRRTVEGFDTQRRLPSFAEVKRVEVERRREAAKQRGLSAAELLGFADEEIKRLREDMEAQSEESGELLAVAEGERDDAEAEIERLGRMVYKLQERLRSLHVTKGGPTTMAIPDNLDELEEWANEHLAGSVELHNRALRGAKDSQYENAELVYDALLLLRDYYVPMRRGADQQAKRAFDRRCRELGISERRTFAGDRAGEHGDTYFIKIGKKRVLLDQHLKKGTSRDPRRCFRLYFCWDDNTNQVVVGWLPSHLRTRIS